MGFGNHVKPQFIAQETPAMVVNNKDQVELMFDTLKDLQTRDTTGKLSFLEDLSSTDYRSERVEELRIESSELLGKAAAAGIEISDLYPNLNADILLLLGAFYGVDPSKLEKKMYIYRPIWREGVDGKIPAAGGTAEDLKIVRGMRVGNEDATHNEERKGEWVRNPESGLFLRGKGRVTQRQEGGQMIADFNQGNDQGLNQAWFDPAAYVIISAQRRLRGEPPLDIETFTRFLDMEDVADVDDVWTPNAYWVHDRLSFSWSSGCACSLRGGRFSVGQKPLGPNTSFSSYSVSNQELENPNDLR